MSAHNVAVVGAGPAGLAAAVQLASRGCHVTLLEGAPRAGGQIRTVHRDGWVVEEGALLVAEPGPQLRTLLDAAGLDTRTVRAAAAARRRYVVHEGTPQPIPATLGELVSSPLLSIGGRLRMAKEPFVQAGGADDESVDAFARRRFGDEVAERLFDSLVAEMSGGDSRQTLVRYLFPKLREFEQATGSVLKGQVRAGMEQRRRMRGKPQGAWSCPGGLTELVEALTRCSGVRLVTSAEVTRVERHAHRYRLTTSGNVEEFDGVVFAVPAEALVRVTGPSEWRDEMAKVASIPTAPVAAVTLGYRRGAVAHPLDGLSIRVPSREKRPVLTMLVPTAIFEGRAPEGHVMITTLIGGVAHPEAAMLPPAELVELVHLQLGDLIGATGEPSFRNVATWPRAFPQAVAGHGERLAAAESLERGAVGVVFTGGWRDGISVGDALRGGAAAAERVMASVAPS